MVYLDNASTKQLSNDMKEYLISLLDVYGNPSSLHFLGVKSHNIVEDARRKVAEFIHVNTNDVYFTSGGSSSNTLGIKGFCERNNCVIFYSPTVHKSILNLIDSKTIRNRKISLNVDNDGFIDLVDLEQKIIGTKPFVVIECANSEIGTIQDIKKIIDLVHFYKGIIYIDCTGSIPTIPLDVKALDVDILGFSGHKLGALKGCGVLYKKKSIELEPLIYGTQEYGLVGGTENVLGIASLGKVIENYDYSSINSKGRDYLYDCMKKFISDCYLVGAQIDSGRRLPHNLYMCFKNIEGESLMILLDMNGIQVSTGSACSSGNLSMPTTLSAIKMNENDIHSCIRITLSGNETKDELFYAYKKIKESVEHLRGLTYTDSFHTRR